MTRPQPAKRPPGPGQAGQQEARLSSPTSGAHRDAGPAGDSGHDSCQEILSGRAPLSLTQVFRLIPGMLPSLPASRWRPGAGAGIQGVFTCPSSSPPRKQVTPLPLPIARGAASNFLCGGTAALSSSPRQVNLVYFIQTLILSGVPIVVQRKQI